MRHHRSSRPGPRRRPALAVLALVLVAVAVPLVGASPAGATTAPLETDDGIGFRISDTAVLGPVLDSLEADLQTVVNARLATAAVAGAPLTSYQSVSVSADLELSYDIAPPTSGLPNGSLKLHADLLDVVFRYRTTAWWHSECSVWLEPADSTVDSRAAVTPNTLPARPLTLAPVVGYWDDDPTVSTSGACWTYLIDEWWDGWYDAWVEGPASMGELFGADIDGAHDDLLDDMWWDDVDRVMDSLEALADFDVDVNALYTDTHGLVATADVDGTGGLTIPGVGGPYSVGATEDAGVSHSIHTLLANTSLDAVPSDVIIAVHPNVTNQFFTALTTGLGGHLATTGIDATIESQLLNAVHRPWYNNNAWSMRLRAQAPPEGHPTGPNGLPQLAFPQVTLEFLNPTLNPSDPRVATFSGSVTDVDFTTAGTSGAGCCLPDYDPSAATWTATLTQADAQAAVRTPPTVDADLVPWLQVALADFISGIPAYVDLDPQGLYGHGTVRNTSTTRYTGDQRYTTTFDVT